MSDYPNGEKRVISSFYDFEPPDSSQKLRQQTIIAGSRITRAPVYQCEGDNQPDESVFNPLEHRSSHVPLQGTREILDGPYRNQSYNSEALKALTEKENHDQGVSRPPSWTPSRENEVRNFRECVAGLILVAISVLGIIVTAIWYHLFVKNKDKNVESFRIVVVGLILVGLAIIYLGIFLRGRAPGFPEVL